MEEYRFLSITKSKDLPTFVRIEAESRIDAVESFAYRHQLLIRQITDETVSFHRMGQPRHRQIFYSVSGCDPWLKLLS